jgi:hypothetical protein
MARASGEVVGGDLQREEDEAGAAMVDLVGGEAEDDFVEGGLELVAITWGGEGEGAATVAGGEVADGFALVVMVVAEGLAVEGRGAAAVAVGEGVGAGGAGTRCGGGRHGDPLPGGMFRGKVLSAKGKVGVPATHGYPRLAACGLNAKARRWPG